jgi:hypothetical protein
MSYIPCISLLQPWATLLLAGAKRFETRGWQTAHRGRLAIHAGRRFPPAAHALCRSEPFRNLLHAAGCDDPEALPLGAVLGTVELVRCSRVEDLDLTTLSAQEQSLGDFRPGRWVWELRDPKLLTVPVATAGRLGVFLLPLSLFQP